MEGENSGVSNPISVGYTIYGFTFQHIKDSLLLFGSHSNIRVIYYPNLLRIMHYVLLLVI